MDLLEIKEKHHLTREEAAAWLRELADSLARHNEVEFVRHGVIVRYGTRSATVDVADQVKLKVELEIEDDESELEVKISW